MTCTMRLSATALLPALGFLLCILARATADVLNTPLCGEVHGFADEYNDHLHIPITDAVGNQEAVVLIARAFPLQLGFLTRGWLQLEATYKISAGAEVTLSSDGNGILILSNVARGSEIDVRVHNRRADGPVPFRFFSMQANSPTCYVAVSPTNAFYAPLPRKISVTDEKGASIVRSATYFFKTTLTDSHNAATISVIEEPGGPREFFSLSDDEKSWIPHSSGELVTTSPDGTLLYTFSPEESGSSEFALVRISAQPGDSRGGNPTQSTTTTTSKPSGGGDSTSNPTATPTPSVQPLPHTKAGSAFFSFLRTVAIIGLVVLGAYMIGCTYYNVHVKGVREFPEMIPFSEQFRACWRAVQLCFARLTGTSAGRHAREYDSIGDQDFYK